MFVVSERVPRIDMQPSVASGRECVESSAKEHELPPGGSLFFNEQREVGDGVLDRTVLFSVCLNHDKNGGSPKCRGRFGLRVDLTTFRFPH